MVARLNCASRIVIMNFCYQVVVYEATSLVGCYLKYPFPRKADLGLFIDRAKRAPKLYATFSTVGSQNAESEIGIETPVEDLFGRSCLHDITLFQSTFNNSSKIRVRSKSDIFVR
jgi:hypothetical protein